MRIEWFVGLIFVMAGCSSHLPEYQNVQAIGSEVRIAREDVSDGEVHFFTYKHQGKTINFLIRTDGDGELHAHFDACFSCYRYKRGFVVEGPELVCVACRYAYRIEEEVWDLIGACAPITFHFGLDRDWVVIKQSVLDKGGRFFS